MSPREKRGSEGIGLNARLDGRYHITPIMSNGSGHILTAGDNQFATSLCRIVGKKLPTIEEKQLENRMEKCQRAELGRAYEHKFKAATRHAGNVRGGG